MGERAVIHLTLHELQALLAAHMIVLNPSRTVTAQGTRLRLWVGKAYNQRRRFATFGAALLTVAVGYNVVFGHNGLAAFQQKRQDAQSLDRQLKVLARENEALKGHVDRLQEDPDAIEHQAREELHYTRAGEVIVTLPPEHTVSPR